MLPELIYGVLYSVTGEFGMVYKAHYLPGPKNGRTAEPQIVAVKTLKGMSMHDGYS